MKREIRSLSPRDKKLSLQHFEVKKYAFRETYLFFYGCFLRSDFAVILLLPMSVSLT